MNLEKAETLKTEKDKHLESLEKKNTSIYLIYYLSNLYANMILLSLYSLNVYQKFPSCIDERNGQNVTYSFEEESNPDGIFKINPLSGKIVLVKSLDREVSNLHFLKL